MESKHDETWAMSRSFPIWLLEQFLWILDKQLAQEVYFSHIFPSEPWNADEFHVFPMKRRRTFRISHLNHLRQPLPFSIFPESWKVEKASQGQVACYFKSQNKGSFWCFAYICFWKHKLTSDIICKCFWSSSFNLAQVKRPSQATPVSPAAMQISWLWPGCIQAWRIWAWTMVSKGNQGL